MNELKELIEHIDSLFSYYETYEGTGVDGAWSALTAIKEWAQHKINSTIRKSPF